MTKASAVRSSQFCTEMARPERFERPTLRFVVANLSSSGRRRGALELDLRAYNIVEKQTLCG